MTQHPYPHPKHAPDHNIIFHIQLFVLLRNGSN